MGDVSIDLVPIWTAIIALGVFLYVLLDGFDLGVGMLYGFAPKTDRDTVMNAIAPVWDGNETWLILGALALLAVFPLAFAIIIPAVYFPILLMLLALVFRGVAFEFRFRQPRIAHFWSRGFFVGSAIATFSQGSVLGAFIQGFNVQDRAFVGSSWGWFTPFSILTGIALMSGYGLLGAGWLIIKTEGGLQAWARRAGRICLGGVVVAIVVVSLWTPFADSAIAQRWFSLPNLILLAPVPILTAVIAWLGWRCRGIPFRDGSVSDVLSRHRDQPVADDSAWALHVMAGSLGTGHAGVPADRDAAASAGHPHVYRLVILGVSRKGARRYRIQVAPRSQDPHRV